MPGTRQTAAGTDNTPPMCADCVAGQYCPGGTTPPQACGAGTWDHDANPATSCIPWSDCAAGQAVAMSGSTTANRVCADCPPNSFSLTANAPMCAPWMDCAPGQSVMITGTPTANRVCMTCPAGTFSGAANSTSCSPWTECTAGQYISVAGSAIANRACAMCPMNSYSSGTNTATCMSWSECVFPGQYESTPGTTISNRVCSTPTSCMPGQHVLAAATPTTDQTCTGCGMDEFSTAANSPACTPFTVCTAAQYKMAEGTSTSDRTCASLTQCAPGKHVMVAATPTSDQTCAACDPDTFSATANQPSCSPLTVCTAPTQYMSTAPSAAADSDRVCMPCATGATTMDNQTSCL
jgi:hypothetical protein